MANALSAASLQKVITTHVNTLLKSMDNILFTALSSSSATHSHTTTAVQDISTSIETGQVIRAAEEIMVLTRTLRSLWCAGRLDVIESSKNSESNEAMEAQGMADLADSLESWKQKMEEALRIGTKNLSPDGDAAPGTALYKSEDVNMGEG